MRRSNVLNEMFFYKYRGVYVPREHYEGLVNIGIMPGKHENAWNF